MPNPTAGRGFRPIKLIGGQPFSGSATAYRIASGYAGNIGLGDPVKQLATGYINVAAATDTVRGICAGVEYVGTDGVPVKANNWKSGTTTLGAQDAIIYVYDDPNLVFEVRALNSASVLTVAAFGNTFNSFNLGSVDATGTAASGVDASTTAGTATVWKLIGFSEKVDNDRAAANPLLWVVPALHELKQSAGI